jgi:hypothetical protein
MEKKRYYITNAQVSKANGGYYLSYTYGGEDFWAQGEFHLDSKGYLHHTHITKTGKEIDVKVKIND